MTPSLKHCESILLIDDSASVREVLRVAPESEGHSVLEAADDREGVRLYREHRPAVVITDIVMPEKDGIATVREILAINPAVTFTMPVRDEDYQYVAKLLGAKRGFRKPVSVEELLAAVCEACARCRPGRERRGHRLGLRVRLPEYRFGQIGEFGWLQPVAREKRRGVPE